MNKKVVCFGEVLWDCFGEEKKPGGAPMNVAVHLRKHGLHSVLISAVGEDEEGKRMRDFMAGKGLDLFYIQTNTAFSTGLVEVSLDKDGNATYEIVKPVAWDAIGFKPGLEELVKNADAFVFGSLAARDATSRATLLQLLGIAKLKVFDMNLRPPHFTVEVLEELLHKTDILKINEDELRYLENQYALTEQKGVAKFEWLSRKFDLQLIVVTFGKRGATAWHKEKLVQQAGFDVDVVDTVGAGDAFLAAFIAGMLEQRKLSKILEQACAAGAEVASRAGANPDYL